MGGLIPVGQQEPHPVGQQEGSFQSAKQEAHSSRKRVLIPDRQEGLTQSDERRALRSLPPPGTATSGRGRARLA